MFQSNRPHHDDKKAASASGRPPVDYREYREKKERERLDREKAAAAGQGHAHHHKPVPTGAQLPGKHPVPPPGQKPHVHHNHHHNRPEIKPGAQISAPQLGPAPSRHSLNSQQRESASRQRVPREYNSSSGTSGGTVFTHGHGPPAGDGSSSGVPMTDGRSEPNLSAETSQEKQGNNNSHAAHHSADSKHLQPPTSSDNKRQYDPARHKPPEHRKEDSQKLYGKYNTSDTARIERQRKQPDILEQRSEEVRKLIEKPIMLPLVAQKTRQEIQKEEYAASMVKQSHHHAKYGQEKLQGNPVVVLNQMKPPFGTREKSPANANATQQMMAKANKPMQAGPYSHHATAQVSKDGVRNGNTAPVTTPMTVNLDDIKTEKKPKLEELERTATPYSATPPGAKHRSLFSPEKTIAAPRESSHPQRAKLKQKMDSAMRSVKQEPIGVKLPTELMSHFTSPTTAVNHPQMEHTQSFKRSVNETATSSSHKRHRASSICEPEQTPRIKEEPGGIEAMKMIGRVPDLIQPIRDNPTSSNGKNSSVANDLKPPELIKPFEPEPLGAPAPAQSAIQQPLSNGYDLSRINPAQENQDGRYAQPTVGEHTEYLSPLKSARGISALLQENTIPPLPSILQQQQQQLGQGDNTVDRIGEAPVGASATVQTATLTTTTTTVTTVTEEKRSEHHKSEKKKKKDKHKHKDKDKGKEERKHKHKHKDREKDRHHRDKESRGGGGDDGSTIPNSGGGNAATIPIKITIPKDKINLGAGGDATSTHTPSEGSSLKIKIPKERLKGGDNNPSEAQIHAPLKMKIRTGAGIGNNMEARKRERDADVSPTILGGGPPPLKKHTQPPAAGGTTGNYIHRTSVTGERQQNGRHYPGGSTGNNKVRGGGRGGRQFPARGNYSYFGRGHNAQYNRHVAHNPYMIRAEYPHLNSSLSSPSSAPFNTASPSFYFSGYQNPHNNNQIYNHPGFHIPYDPCIYMQQYHQTYQLYQHHNSGNIIVTPEGTSIDTSVPPPFVNVDRNDGSNGTVPPPLPTGPPPESSPPPPPPPE